MRSGQVVGFLGLGMGKIRPKLLKMAWFRTGPVLGEEKPLGIPILVPSFVSPCPKEDGK